LEVILDGRRISRWFLIGIILVLFGIWIGFFPSLDIIV
jgi:hypothetical protein